MSLLMIININLFLSMYFQPPPGFPSSLYTFNERAFGSPPPAHMGIPSVHIDPKTGMYHPIYFIIIYFLSIIFCLLYF